MAIDFITIDTSTTTAKFATDLIRFKDVLREVIERADKLRGIMDHLNNGADFTQIEQKFGLAVGQGTTINTFITNCRSAVRSASTLEFIDRVG